MTKEVARSGMEDRPCVAIASDYENVGHALAYEEQLYGLGFQTEWVIASEALTEWKEMAKAVVYDEEGGAIRHPYSYSLQYRRSTEKVLKATDFLEESRAIIHDADVVLGVNRHHYAETKNPLTPFVTDYLLMGVAFKRLVIVSESFPTIGELGTVGSYRHGMHQERALQLHALGIKRAKSDMNRVAELWGERNAIE